MRRLVLLSVILSLVLGVLALPAAAKPVSNDTLVVSVSDGGLTGEISIADGLATISLETVTECPGGGSLVESWNGAVAVALEMDRKLSSGAGTGAGLIPYTASGDCVVNPTGESDVSVWVNYTADGRTARDRIDGDRVLTSSGSATLRFLGAPHPATGDATRVVSHG